jgi:hypothetical protein
MTGAQLVQRALARLGAIGATDVPDGDDLAKGLELLNAFVDGLGAERLSMYKLLRTAKTLASGTASYTIGTGGDISIVRPLTIQRAGLITNTSDATPMEVPIRVYHDDEWAGIVQKTLTGTLLQGIWYDHDFASSMGRIYVWPIPSGSTTQLILYTPVAVSEFDETTDVVLPPGYERMLEYNLACECADAWEKPLNPRTERIAATTLSRLKGVNLRPTRLAMPPGMPGLRRGRGDIRSGS